MNETFSASSFKFEDDEPQGKSFSADSFKFDDDAEKPSEEKKDEKPSIPDIPRGFSPTIDMANDVAEEAQRRAAEEPKFKTRKERKSRMVSGTQVSTYGAVPTMEGYDADTVDEITDTKGNVAKRGDLFGVERKDGTSRLYEFTGDDEKGHPTFRRLTEEEANGRTAKASMSGDVFRRMRGEGRIKMDSSAIEQVRQGVLSETGREDVYGEGALGQLAAVATRAIPYIGRGNADRYKWQLQKLDEMSRGDFGGKDYIWLYKSGIFDDDKVNVIRTKDESEEDWQKRMQAAASDELKKRVTAMQDAEEELGATDKGAWDKILGGFIDSSGYALEFAVPGGAVGKGVKGWNVIKGGGLLAKIGNAAIRQNVVSAPVTLAEASSRYTEMRTPGFAIDEDGNPYIRDMVDSPGAAALKSIGGALFDTNVEIGLEPVAMGMFRLGKRTAGMAFDKWTPQLMEGLAKNYGKFAHSSTGRLMHDFAKAYGEFADVTAINSPLGELAEEDVQALERVFNLDGKTSEYARGGGFAAEWSRFKNDQMSAKTQFDTFLGLVGQLLVGSAVSAYRTHGYRNSEEYQEGLKQERDLKGVLRLANVSEDTINSLSPEQMAVLGDMWKRYSANPDELKKNTRGLGLALRAAGVEMANRDGVRFRDSLEADGIEPEKFVFQGDESGRPVFKGITRIHGDNKTEQMDAMSDGKHGVTIVDNHDGTYSVMNDWRGSVPSIFNDFDRARAEADNQVMLNQRMDGDNERKAAYFEKYVAPNYEGRSIHVVQTVQQLREEVLQGVTQGGEEGYFGAKDASSIFDENGELREKSAGGFHTPDGTTVLILDNIVSPADMERVTAHEAVGHEGVEGQVGRDEVVEFIGGVRAKDFSGFANGIWRKMTQDYIRKGYSTEEAQQIAADICDSDRGRKEIMAKYAEQRRHLPTDQELKQHDENEKRRAAGEDVPTDDADLEVMLWKAEQEARQSNPDKKHTKAGAVIQEVDAAETHDNAPASVSGEEGATSQPEAEKPTEGEGGVSGGAREEFMSEIGEFATESDKRFAAVATDEEFAKANELRTRARNSGKEEDLQAFADFIGGVVTKADEASAKANETAGVKPTPTVRSVEDYVTAKPDMIDAEKSALTEAVKKVGDETDEMQIAGDKGILGSLLKRGPLMLLDPQKVDTSDEELPNFKLGVDRKTGIRTPLEGKWMPSLAGFGVVWLRSDGKLVQATGRHRNQKAREANEPMWNVVLRESDGWTKEKMALIDGTFNIKDGKGDVADYVRFFEDSGFDRKDAEENGLLSDKGLVAWSIYADATDATRAATDLTGSGEDGKITPEQASIIAQAAPKGENPRNGLIQSVLLRKAQAGKRGEAFRGYARMMANDLRSSKANANLTEGQQMDLFMNDPEVLAIDALNEKRSAYMMKKSGEFADQANLLRTAITKGTKLELRPEAAKALGIEDANDKEQLKAAYDKALHLSDYWNPAKDHVLDEADKSAMDTEINAKADANAKRREELKAKLAAVKSGKPLPKKAVSKKETTAPEPAVGENKKTSEKVVHPKTAENKAKTGVVDENANAKPKVVHQNESNANGKDNRPIARIAAALEAKDKKAGKAAEQSLIDDIANGVPFPSQKEIDEIAATLPENMRKPFLDGMEKWRKFSDEQQAGATEEEKPESSDKKSGKKSSSEEITDVGEKIAGARKDLIRDYVAALNDATKEQLAELPFSKAFKKPDLAKAIESGALREQDALFYDAVLALVNPRKPRIKKNDEWRKKYNPGFRSDLDKWVDNTYNALQTLKGFLELDEAGRDKLIEKSLSQEYLDVDADKRRMEELQRMNNRELKFGESYTPNPVHVTAEILRRLGYKAGDKVEIPFPTIRTSTVFDSYTPQSHEGNGIYLDSAKTLDEVIDAMVYLTKLNRGDADLRHPDRAFSIKHTRNIVGETGKFIVMWGGKYGMNNQRKFDTKKEADEFAKSKNSIATPERAVTGRTDYVIRFRNLAKGTELPLGEQKFGTKEEAQKYLEDNRDALNDAANEAIAKEAGRKVEKRKMTPDDLVKIGMFHGSKGLSWGVYVDNPASESGRELLRDGFKGRDEAKKYRDEIKDAYFARWNESNEKRKAFVFFDVGDEKRIGEDWRGGKDMKAEDFMNTFGFRGVQFGNWTNQDDRQMAVNQAFDAFKDLAKLIGVPDKAISLNGELGIAFGARGSGNALAHYEPDEIVINLTKTRGAGSLAHEWWHALDNYFARAAGVKHGMVTDSQTIKMRDELREAFNRLVREIEFSNYYRRSKKQGAYWGRMHEVTARLLAEWVDQELKRNGELNTFLSRGAKNAEAFAEMNYELYRGEMEAAKKEPLSFDEFKKTEKAYQGFPYPTAEEVEKFGGLLRGIFDTVETDADTGILWDTDLLKTEQPNTHDIVKDGKTVFTGRFHTDSQADGYARHFYGEGAKAVRRETVDFDTNLSATLEPEAWGDPDRKVRVVGNGVAPWKYVKGKSMKEAKEEIAALAIKNIKSQENYTETGSGNALALKIGDVLFRIPVRNLFHGSARNINAYGQAASIIGDVMNAAVEIPNVESPWHYYIASANFGRPCYVLVTATEGLDGAKNVINMQTLYSVNTKTSGAARELNHTNASRLDEDSISNLRDAWQSLFLPGLERHNAGKSGKLEKSDESERPKIEIRGRNDVTVSTGVSTNDERIFNLFYHFNGNADSKRIADKVFQLARKLEFALYMENNIGDLQGWHYGEIVAFNADWLSDRAVPAQKKADTILHEFIHHLTEYAIDAVSGKANTGKIKISQELRDAVKDLESIYEQTRDEMVKDDATKYAYTYKLEKQVRDKLTAEEIVTQTKYARMKELLAELSDPNVRAALKRQNIWSRIVDGIRRIISALDDILGAGLDKAAKGAEVKVNALDAALENLDAFLDNLDYRFGGEDYYRMLKRESDRRDREDKKWRKRARKIARTEGVNYKRGNEVDFDTDLPSMSDVKEMSEEEQDKLFGFTNDDVRFRMEAMGLKPSKNAKTTVEAIEEQAEFLLSNPDYMKKLVKAVAQWNYGGRTVSAAESAAIGKYYVRAAEELNAEREYVDELEKSVKGGELDEDEDKKELSDSKKKLKESLRWFNTVCQANKTVGSNAGLTLMSRRIKVNPNDHSFAGIVNSLIEVSGGTRADGSFKFPDEMIETANELAKKFSELEGEEYKFYANRWKAYSEKVFSDIAKVVSVRKAGEKKVGDAAKIVTRKYLDALTQVEVHSREGNSDIAGLDPKWLKSIAEWHCFQKPDITESEMVSAMRDDIAAFFPDITENEIRRAYTQYGHHFKQSKRESQAIMNDRKAQSLKKLQLQTMREEGRLPPTTGMERSDPSDELRALNKEVYEEKKLTPEGAANSLKGIIESIKRRLDNQIADAEREIATGELVPRRERKVVDDVEIIRKRARLAELRKQRDEIFGLHKGMTEEQRVKAVERALASELERATADLDRARSGDFSKRPKASPVQSDAANRYREQIAAVRREIRELKSAKYAFGMTPEEIDALNRRKIENRRKAIENKAFMIETGTLPTKREQPPMTPEQKKEYEELGRQNQRANQRLRDLRLDARDASLVAPARWVKEWAGFVKNIVPGVVASFDRSAILRQGLKGTMTHPVWFLKDEKLAEKAAFNREFFETLNEQILNDPDIREASENYGLFVRSSDIDYQHDVEMFHGRNVAVPYGIRRIAALAGQIPAVGRFGRSVGEVLIAGMENSERHYVTYLNLMSSQLYKAMLQAIPNASEWQKRQLAEIVNIATGAGGMSKEVRHKVQAFNDMLGHPIWSPNLLVSQLESVIGYDIWGQAFGSAEGGRDGGKVGLFSKERLEVAKEAVKFRLKWRIATTILGAVLAYMFAPDDWWEEWKRKPWYKKFYSFQTPMIGNAHIDLTAGEMTAFRSLVRMFSRTYSTSTGREISQDDFGGKGFWELFGRYLGSKAAPHYGNLVSLLKGKDYTNQDFGWKDFLLSYLPLTPVDIVKIAKDEKWVNMEAPAAMVMALLGAGGNTYEEPFFARTVNSYLDNPDVPSHEKAAIRRAYRDASKLRKSEKAASGAEKDAIRKERESIEGAVKKAAKENTPMRNLGYPQASASFANSYNEYRDIERDQKLTDAERKERLSKIEASNPLMKDDVRIDIKKMISGIDRLKDNLKKLNESGDESYAAEIEKDIRKQQDAVMKIVRGEKEK